MAEATSPSSNPSATSEIYRTIVSTKTVATHLHNPNWVIVDCRFDLTQPERGRADYLAAHIPGAVYADLNRDLSAPMQPGLTGRHPLPNVEEFAARLGQWGIDEGVQVVVYDESGGLYSGRLWWMLRWVGHTSVALLDGDWRAWQREGRPTAAGEERRSPRTFVPTVEKDALADAAEIAAALESSHLRLFDARSPDRYRGENETLDPRAGHIPGALSAHFGANLTDEGYFRPAAELRDRFETLLDGAEPEECVFYCGSGVSAAHDLVALEIAGLGGARLYPGSWSDWITDPSRPIVTGPLATSEVA